MEGNEELFNLRLDAEASANITEACRWGRLLSVLGLIAMGIVFLLIILLRNVIVQELFASGATGTETSMLSVGIVMGCLFVAVIVAILLTFLLKGTSRIRQGIQRKDQYLFNSGLANLKNYFAMYGILGIISLLFAVVNLFNR
jgi:hypothetical protein